MPNASLDDMIQRYRQELLQYQKRSTAAPPAEEFAVSPAKSVLPEPPSATPPGPLPTPELLTPSPEPFSSPMPSPDPPAQSRPPFVPLPDPGSPSPMQNPSAGGLVSSPLAPPIARPVPPPPGNSPPDNPPAQTPMPFPTPECSDNYTESGKLRISVFTARQALPVADADVTVFCTLNGTEHLHYFLKTDQSGNTPAVLLPAPPAALSESPDNGLTYAVYGVRVHADGFVPSEMRNVQVFSGVTGTVSFDLIPSPGISLPTPKNGR